MKAACWTPSSNFRGSNPPPEHGSPRCCLCAWPSTGPRCWTICVWPERWSGADLTAGAVTGKLTPTAPPCPAPHPSPWHCGRLCPGFWTSHPITGSTYRAPRVKCWSCCRSGELRSSRTSSRERAASHPRWRAAYGNWPPPVWLRQTVLGRSVGWSTGPPNVSGGAPDSDGVPEDGWPPAAGRSYMPAPPSKMSPRPALARPASGIPTRRGQGRDSRRQVCGGVRG